MNHYKTNFWFAYNKVFSLEIVGDMMPWEKEIYGHLLLEQLEKEKQELEDLNKHA